MPHELHAPGVTPSFVDRPRINAILDKGMDGLVTLVCAPAGWGKTSAVAAWAALRDPAQVRWVTLDEADNDPIRLRRLVTAPVPAVLVLDRAEVIVAEAAMRVLASLIRERPPLLRIVLCSRVEPQLPLAQLRRTAELTEIGAADLAFTAGEAAALFDSGTPTTEVRERVEWTEGWAAGLCLQSTDEYLRREVLAGQPPELKEFLLGTSIVDRLCGSLAQALTGSADAPRRLRELIRQGLFVDDDGERRWVRSHRMVRDFLRREALDQLSDQLPALHVRAARWWSEHGEPTLAVRHAVAADRWRYASRLAPEPIGSPAALPTPFVETVTRLADIGTMRLRDEHADLVRRAGDLLGRLATATATGTGAPATVEQIRAVAHLHAGVGQLWCGLLDASARSLDQSVEIATRHGLDSVVGDALGHHALHSAVRGKLRDASDRATAALRAAEVGGSPATAARIALAIVCLERTDAEGAERHLARAAADDRGGATTTVATEILRARMWQSSGELARARAALALAGQQFRKSGPPPMLRAWLSVAAAEQHLLEDRPDVALATVDGVLHLRHLDPVSAPGRITAARAHLTRGAPARARSLLAPLHAPGASVGIGAWIEAWLVDALAAAQLGLRGAVCIALGHALAAAEPEGFRRPFRLGGDSLSDLLVRYRDVVEPYHRFVDGLDANASVELVRPGRVLPETITEREAVVLRYLPTLLTAHEIAGELCVSRNTVKTQLKSLYRKLDVRTRRAAVDRARHLGLLPRG